MRRRSEPKYNHPILKHRRQELRRKQTKAEDVLWNHLRDRKLENLKIYRQYSVGPYILDFFFPAVRIAVELDGGHHSKEEVRKYDEERLLFLESEDIRVIRFRNEEVEKDVGKVVERIRVNLRPSLSVREGQWKPRQPWRGELKT